MKIFRHGDMILYKVSEVEGEHSAKKNTILVGLGEVTGHAHQVAPLNDGVSSITVFADKKVETVTEDDLAMMDKLFFEISGNGALITHEEHDPILLEKGKYLRINQVEVDPFTKELQKVKD